MHRMGNPGMGPGGSSMPPGARMAGMGPGMMPGGPGGPQGGGMYGGGPNMMSDVRMRAQSRYRLGNPNASSMRQPMPNSNNGGPQGGNTGPSGPGPQSGPPGGQGGPMTVPQGQQSPMGGGPNNGPGNMPQMMPNQGMRQQVKVQNNFVFSC